jgi:hypothetical protein
MSVFKIGTQKAKRIINIGTEEDIEKNFDVKSVEADTIVNIAGNANKRKTRDRTEDE